MPYVKKVNWKTALLLSVFLGHLGIDRFYFGHVGLGIAKLLTLGGFSIWWLIDIILVATKKVNGVEFESKAIKNVRRSQMAKNENKDEKEGYDVLCFEYADADDSIRVINILSRNGIKCYPDDGHIYFNKELAEKKNIKVVFEKAGLKAPVPAKVGRYIYERI